MRLLVIILLVAACAGGSEAPPHVEDLETLFNGQSSSVARWGSSDDAVSSFARVVGAAASPDGSSVVVLDRSPPFVRIFNRSHSPIAVLPRGQGPGESRGPYSVAADQGGFLVLDGGAKLYDWDGELLAEGVIQNVRAAAVLRGCGGDWFVYGPSSEPINWIHTLHVVAPDTFQTEGIFEDPTQPKRLALGKQYLFTGNSAEFLLYHENGAPKRMLAWSCGERPHHEASLAYLMPLEREPEVQEGEGGVTLTMTYSGNEPQFAGAAVVQAGVLRAESIFKISPPSLEPEVETVLRLVENDVEYAATVDGFYTLHGATATGVLFSTYEPFPQVLLVDMSALRLGLYQGVRRKLVTDAPGT